MELQVVGFRSDWHMGHTVPLIEWAHNMRIKPGQCVIAMNRAGNRVRAVAAGGRLVFDVRGEPGEVWSAEGVERLLRSELGCKLTLTAKQAKQFDALADLVREFDKEAA